MPKYSTFEEAVRDNEKKQCHVNGCYEKRFRIGRHCINHHSRQQRWGHPLAYPIRRWEFKNEIEEVRDLFSINQDHRGLQVAVNFLKTWMQEGNDNPNSKSIPEPRLLGRLHAYGVDPMEVLIRIAGLWLFDKKDTIRRTIKSDKHLDTLTGREIARFKSTRETILGSRYRAIGAHVRANIGRFLIHIAHTIETRKQQREASFRVFTEEFRQDGKF